MPRGAEGMAIESVLRAVVRVGLHRVLFEVEHRGLSSADFFVAGETPCGVNFEDPFSSVEVYPAAVEV